LSCPSHGIDLDLEHFAQTPRLDTVDEHLQTALHEGITQTFDLPFEHEQPFLARDRTPRRHLLDDGLVTAHRRHEHPLDHLEAIDEDTQRTLQHDRTNRAPDHDQKRGGLHQRRQVPTLKHLSDENGGQSERDANEADAIHGDPSCGRQAPAGGFLGGRPRRAPGVLPDGRAPTTCTRRRAMAWLWS